MICEALLVQHSQEDDAAILLLKFCTADGTQLDVLAKECGDCGALPLTARASPRRPCSEQLEVIIDHRAGYADFDSAGIVSGIVFQHGKVREFVLVRGDDIELLKDLHDGNK